MIPLMESIADPCRRAILAELLHGPKKVGDIVAATGLRQPNVSNHLSKMRARGLVKSSKVNRCCELVDELVLIRGPSLPFLLGVGGLATNGRGPDLVARGVDFTAEGLAEFAEKTLPDLCERVSAAPAVG